MESLIIHKVPTEDTTTTTSSDQEQEPERIVLKYLILKNKKSKTYEFEVIKNRPDGSCLFRAISQAVYRKQSNHAVVRAQIVDHITEDTNWKKYLPFIQAQHDHLSPRKRVVIPTTIETTTTTDSSDGEKNRDRVKNRNTVTVDPLTLRLKTKYELKAEARALELEAINWKAEYLDYMRRGSAYGTMQEILAAAEFYHFNLIIIREIDADWYNVQNFSELGWTDTQFFIFTGDSDAGHFELLAPVARDTLEYDLPNGDYEPMSWNPYKGLLVIKEVLRKSCSLDRLKLNNESNMKDSTKTKGDAGTDSDAGGRNGTTSTTDARADDVNSSSSCSTVNSTRLERLTIRGRRRLPLPPEIKLEDSMSEYESCDVENLDLEIPSPSRQIKSERHRKIIEVDRGTLDRHYRHKNWPVTDYTLGLSQNGGSGRGYTPNLLEYTNKPMKIGKDKELNGNRRTSRENFEARRQRRRESVSNQTLFGVPGCTSSGTIILKTRNPRSSKKIQPSLSNTGGIGFISLSRTGTGRVSMEELQIVNHNSSSSKDTRVGQYQKLLKLPRERSKCNQCLRTSLKRIRKGFFCVFCPCIYAKYYNSS